MKSGRPVLWVLRHFRFEITFALTVGAAYAIRAATSVSLDFGYGIALICLGIFGIGRGLWVGRDRLPLTLAGLGLILSGARWCCIGSEVLSSSQAQLVRLCAIGLMVAGIILLLISHRGDNGSN
jgi:hypothetical protein